MTSLIQFRGNTAAYWTSHNPVLAAREMVIETDTMRYKFGDGVKAWTALPYVELTGTFNSVTLNDSADPSIADAGSLIMFARFIAGRAFPAYVGPSGQDTALQPFLARNKIGYWCPQGNSTVLPGVLGYTASTALGTVTARNVVVSNMFTRMRRIGYVSAATAGSITGARVSVAQITTGDGSLGGFTKIIRFGVSDPAAPVAAARMFVGISSNAAAPTNVEPDTWLNSIGVGCRAADTNLQLFASGTTKQTPIDLGANFPATTGTTDVYELALFSAAVSADVYWQVTRLNTGHTAGGKIASGGGVTGPASSTLLTYLQAWRTNNTTAAAVALDIMSDYIETDL